uniref:Smr domain-containing protein n=1 Tax=Plectus sambesii TaxID=2011161 RepID=A0A914UTN0_9BILA
MDSYNQVEALPVFIFGTVLAVAILLVWKSVVRAQVAEDGYSLLTSPGERDRRRTWRDDFYELNEANDLSKTIDVHRLTKTQATNVMDTYFHSLAIGQSRTIITGRAKYSKDSSALTNHVKQYLKNNYPKYSVVMNGDSSTLVVTRT